MTNNLSLYYHIPFCLKKCDYCAFYSLPKVDDSVKEAYFNALIRQTECLDTDRIISTVYFGGGTPPLLRVDRLCKLIKLIKSRFHLSDDCEITVEVNPKTVDMFDLMMLKESGANRLSIGIQSSDDRILASIGRIHSFDDAVKCINDARAVGFNNISADLIFALPDQTVEGLVKSVYDIMSTNVDHISAYSLQIEEGTPIFDRRNDLNFPDEESEEEQYGALCEILKNHGFNHYEISSFARNGFESRHNLNYWARGEYFGFGAGAHSFYMGKRFSTPCDVMRYIELSGTSLFAPTDFDSALPITEKEAEEERIMLGLRTRQGVLLPERSHKNARRIADLGYGTFTDGVLALNSKGFRVSNQIISMVLV